MGQKSQKYTVITGASSGIGYAAAKAFAARRKHLILTARRLERLEALKHEISAQYPKLDIVSTSTDLSVPENAYLLFESLQKYEIETWINNAGIGDYASIADQDPDKISTMLNLNIQSLTILSCLFVRAYKDVDGTQLINVSSAGGYTVVPGAVTYCATKSFVSAFSEGLARELASAGSKMQVKVLAPAATETEFGMVANDVSDYDYARHFRTFHTSAQVADFLLDLYDSRKTTGIVNRESFSFALTDPLFPYAGASPHNQTSASV